LICESINIKLLSSTPYYVQTNGHVEGINKVLINLIKKHIGKRIMIFQQKFLKSFLQRWRGSGFFKF